ERTNLLQPGRLHVERLAAAVGYPMIEDPGVGQGRASERTRTAPRGVEGRIAPGKALAALDVARVVVEVGAAVARGAPVVDPDVVGAVDLGVERIHGDRVARTVAEDPDDAVGETERMARSARAPGVARLLAAELDGNDVADAEPGQLVVRNPERR